MNPFEIHGPAYLGIYIGAALICFLAAFIATHLFRGKTGPLVNRDLKLHPYEIAYLNGGPDLALKAAVGYLVHKGIAVIDSSSSTHRINLEEDPYEALAVIHSENREFDGLDDDSRQNAKELESKLSTSFGRKSWAEVAGRKDLYSECLGRIKKKLLAQGLIVDDSTMMLRKLVIIIGLLVPPLFLGVPRLIEAMYTGRPASFLFILTALSFLSILYPLAIKSARTDAGDDYLKDQKSANWGLYTSSSSAESVVSAEDMILALAIFGPTMMIHPSYSTINRYFTPVSSSSSGSCSSCSSCGGGCGGCGGGCGG